jgi:hypothetical protein
MTGIFKSPWLINRDAMKHLGIVRIILFLGVGLLLFETAAGELTAYQNLVPSAEVGQMVTVTVSLTYNGQNSIQAVVTPILPSGVVANGGGQSLELYPGATQLISYPLTAQQSGSYWIVSDISYAEDGTWRSLQLEAPFTATGSAVPPSQTQPQSDPTQPSGPEPWPGQSTNPADPTGEITHQPGQGDTSQPGGINHQPGQGDTSQPGELDHRPGQGDTSEPEQQGNSTQPDSFSGSPQ